MKQNFRIPAAIIACLMLVVVIFLYREHANKESNDAPRERSANVAEPAQLPATHQTNIEVKDKNLAPGLSPASGSTPLTEYANTASLKAFFDKYKDAPTNSTERYLAEIAFQRCAYVGIVGPDKYLRSSLAKLERSQASDEERRLYRNATDRFVARCKDFHGAMSGEQLKERNAQLLRFPALEAQADQLAERIRTTGINGFRADADKLLITNNPLVMVSLSAAWEEAIRRDRGEFSGRLFSDLPADVAAAAWRLAACEMGWECGTENELVVEACLTAGQCNAASLNDLYQKYLFSPERYNQITKARDGILFGLRTKNYDQLRK